MELLALALTLLVTGIALVLPAVVFVWSFRAMPPLASGWRGGLSRFMCASIFALIAFLLITQHVLAHGWFTDARDPVHGYLCCDGTDCADIPAADVKEVYGGYTYLPTGEFIPHARVQPSQSGSFARCFHKHSAPAASPPYKAGETRCFFAPPGGV